MRWTSPLFVTCLVACGGAPSDTLEDAIHVTGAAVYLVAPGPERATLTEVDGMFRFDGVPAHMTSPTVHPSASALLYGDLTGAVYRMEIERGLDPSAAILDIDCPGQVTAPRVDAESGALAYSCRAGVGSPAEIRRGGEALPACPDQFPPLVIRGDRILCRTGLHTGETFVAFDAPIEIARSGSDGFLAEAYTNDGTVLVSIDDAGAIHTEHPFAASPAEHEGRRIFFSGIGKTAALSAGGTLYKVGRLDEPTRGEQIVFAFDATGATPVTSTFPQDPPLTLVSGP